MRIMRHHAYSRAGLVGNPSDGYHGKTISITVRNFHATVNLYEWDEVEILGSSPDQSRFRSIQELAHDVRLHGYYGGIPLIKATIKKFVEYCARQGQPLHDRNFSVRYESDIPRQVGLAGSSAIVVATLRCLMDYYGVLIPKEVQPSLALAAEREELGITAGLQDRVIQVYEGMVYMDFGRPHMRERSGWACGVYEELHPSHLPPLYLAYYSRDDTSEFVKPSTHKLSSVAERFERGDAAVVGAMRELADLVEQAREALAACDWERLGLVMNRNFDVRRSIYELSPGNIQMVEAARSVGASAKFAGSGGAILGTYRDEAMFQQLTEKLTALGCRVLRPTIFPECAG